MYQIIYADPPWEYGDKNTNGDRGASSKYPCMTKHELFAMSGFVQGIAHKDCALLMWATKPFIPDAVELMNVWGFKYKTRVLTWAKKNKVRDTWKMLHLEMFTDIIDGKLTDRKNPPFMRREDLVNPEEYLDNAVMLS